MMQLKLKQLPKKVIYLLVLFAGLGFIDALYLTIQHYANATPPCFIGSCEQVLTSAYSVVFGIPVALFGVAFYLFILVCLFMYIESKKEKALLFALGATFLGFLADVYFISIQAFVLHAFCQYCLFSAFASMVLFIISLFVMLKFRLKPMNSESL